MKKIKYANFIASIYVANLCMCTYTNVHIHKDIHMKVTKSTYRKMHTLSISIDLCLDILGLC